MEKMTKYYELNDVQFKLSIVDDRSVSNTDYMSIVLIVEDTDKKYKHTNKINIDIEETTAEKKIKLRNAIEETLLNATMWSHGRKIDSKAYWLDQLFEEENFKPAKLEDKPRYKDAEMWDMDTVLTLLKESKCCIHRDYDDDRLMDKILTQVMPNVVARVQYFDDFYWNLPNHSYFVGSDTNDSKLPVIKLSCINHN